MKFLNRVGLIFAACLVFAACDDSNDPNPNPEGGEFPLVEDGTSTLLVLCSGMWNQNNSSLFRYSYETGTSVPDYFLAANSRGLGDTANDMGIYGSKLYIVVNESNTVEIIDRATGKSLKQLSMVDEENSARQPRSVAFYKNKHKQYNSHWQSLYPFHDKKKFPYDLPFQTQFFLSPRLDSN